jgi:hypothetical protein
MKYFNSLMIINTLFRYINILYLLSQNSAIYTELSLLIRIVNNKFLIKI